MHHCLVDVTAFDSLQGTEEGGATEEGRASPKLETPTCETLECGCLTPPRAVLRGQCNV